MNNSSFSSGSEIGKGFFCFFLTAAFIFGDGFIGSVAVGVDVDSAIAVGVDIAVAVGSEGVSEVKEASKVGRKSDEAVTVGEDLLSGTYVSVVRSPRMEDEEDDEAGTELDVCEVEPEEISLVSAA